jgi:hypothetical protein
MTLEQLEDLIRELINNGVTPDTPIYTNFIEGKRANIELLFSDYLGHEFIQVYLTEE